VTVARQAQRRWLRSRGAGRGTLNGVLGAGGRFGVWPGLRGDRQVFAGTQVRRDDGLVAAHSHLATIWMSTTADSAPTTAADIVATARNPRPLAPPPSTERRLAKMRI
jgi:hypothetical protein